MRFPILVAAVFSLFLAQGDESLRIDSPPANGTVSGTVEIRGIAAVTGMIRYSVDFAYGQNPTNTWFPIADGTTPVQHGSLAEWDTTLISEGTYSLRLTAFLQDGSVRDVLAAGIRVRRTAAPAPSSSGETVIPFQPDAQTSGRAAVFPAPTAAFASGPSPSGAALPYREIAFLSGAGLALLAFGTFWVRSRALARKHRRFVLQIRKNESDHE
jgi:hypothetical protein